MAPSSGERVWTAAEGALNPPLVVGGSVFVVNDENRLVRLDAATGAEIWAVDMPYFIKGKAKKRKAIVPHFGPVLAGGRLVVAPGDGDLRLFDPTNGALVGRCTSSARGGNVTLSVERGGVYAGCFLK